MKKLLFIITIVFLVSCKKEETTAFIPLKCRLAKKIHVTSTYSDTTVYTYSGENIMYTVKYSNTATSRVYNYTKSGNKFLYNVYVDGVQSLDGFYTLNSFGYVDSSYSAHTPSMLLNSSGKNYYDVNKNLTRAIGYYTSNINDIKYFYNNGNYSYWIYDVIYPSTPASNKRDSIVFEYYLDKPKVSVTTIFEERYGNLVKNQVKKWSFYNTLSSNTLTKTYEYEYLTDSIGLVTKQIFTAKDQPGNVVTSSDTTYYQYICN